MAKGPFWVIRQDPTDMLWRLDLATTSSRITIPGTHSTHADAYRQAQLLYAASLCPIVDAGSI